MGPDLPAASVRDHLDRGQRRRPNRRVALSTGFRNLPEFLDSDCTAPVLQDRSYLVIDNHYPVRRDPEDYLHASGEGEQRSDRVALGEWPVATIDLREGCGGR